MGRRGSSSSHRARSQDDDDDDLDDLDDSLNDPLTTTMSFTLVSLLAIALLLSSCLSALASPFPRATARSPPALQKKQYVPGVSQPYFPAEIPSCVGESSGREGGMLLMREGQRVSLSGGESPRVLLLRRSFRCVRAGMEGWEES